MNTTTNTDTIIARVPRLFYDDHLARGHTSGRILILQDRPYQYRVELTRQQVADLLSDAEHHATGWRGKSGESFELGRSAAATVWALQRILSGAQVG